VLWKKWRQEVKHFNVLNLNIPSMSEALSGWNESTRAALAMATDFNLVIIVGWTLRDIMLARGSYTNCNRVQLNGAFYYLNIPLAASPRAYDVMYFIIVSSRVFRWRSARKVVCASFYAFGGSSGIKEVLGSNFEFFLLKKNHQVLFFFFPLLIEKRDIEFISVRSAALCSGRDASHRCIRHASTAGLYTRSGPRPFRSPVDRFSAGSTTTALALSNPSSLLVCAARRRNERHTFGDQRAAYVAHTGHIYQLGRTRTR